MENAYHTDPINYAYAKSEDSGKEKHVPEVSGNEKTIHVRVGSAPHPMEEKHFIEWIELHTNFDVYKKELKPGDAPEVDFALEANEVPMNVYAYCNIHGLWVKEMPKRIRTSGCMGEVVNWQSSR